MVVSHRLEAQVASIVEVALVVEHNLEDIVAEYTVDVLHNFDQRLKWHKVGVGPEPDTVVAHFRTKGANGVDQMFALQPVLPQHQMSLSVLPNNHSSL